MLAGKPHYKLLLLALVIPVARLLASDVTSHPLHLPVPIKRLIMAAVNNDSGPVPQALPAADAQGPQVDPSHLDQPSRIERTLRGALRKPLTATRLTVTGGSARLGRYTIGNSETITGNVVVLEGDAEVHGHIQGNVVTLDGDITVFPGGAIAGDVLAIGGKVHHVGDGTISGSEQFLDATLDVAATAPVGIFASTARRTAGFVGLFLTIAVLGFGLVGFGRPNLEIVSDTVSHSFGRSFVAGLLGQVLVLPTFALLMLGLALTIAGTLLIPFAFAVYAILVAVATLIGMLAVAHAMGERITRRRMARGEKISPNSYRYLLSGLSTLATLWLAWTLFGWVPIAGGLMLIIAGTTTWTIATVGFGAALLSRGGIREHFAGRMLPSEMMTDEFLWATPQFGVPAIKRPPRNTP